MADAIEQQLDRLASVVIQEAETIEREMLQNLSAEAKLLTVQEADWKHIQQAIRELKSVQQRLQAVVRREDLAGNKITDGNVIKDNFVQANNLLTSANAIITAVEGHITTAIVMGIAERRVATTAMNKLRDVHNKLNSEAIAIKHYHGW